MIAIKFLSFPHVCGGNLVSKNDEFPPQTCGNDGSGNIISAILVRPVFLAYLLWSEFFDFNIFHHAIMFVITR